MALENLPLIDFAKVLKARKDGTALPVFERAEIHFHNKTNSGLLYILGKTEGPEAHFGENKDMFVYSRHAEHTESGMETSQIAMEPLYIIKKYTPLTPSE